MTLDLDNLRRLAEECRNQGPLWKPTDSSSVREMDVATYDAWVDANHAFRGAATPSVILGLLDRLAMANQRALNTLERLHEETEALDRAEAKLAKVRAWSVWHCPRESRESLDAILDGKDAP